MRASLLAVFAVAALVSAISSTAAGRPEAARSSGALLCQTKVKTMPYTCVGVARAFRRVGIELGGGFIWQPGGRTGGLTFPGFSDVVVYGPEFFVDVVLYRAPREAEESVKGPLGSQWRFYGYAVQQVRNVVALVEPLARRERFVHHQPLKMPNQVLTALYWLQHA